MSVLIEFVEWVKSEAEKSDDGGCSYYRKEKISALFEAVSYRNNRLTESDSDNSEAVGSPINISPLRVMILLFQMHPMRSIQQHWDKLKVSALLKKVLINYHS
jgi:hypothetical protein